MWDTSRSTVTFVYLFHIFSGTGAPRQGNVNPFGEPANFSPIPVSDRDAPLMKHLPLFYTSESCISDQSVDISFAVKGSLAAG
jgi:hypothetical protein